MAVRQLSDGNDAGTVLGQGASDKIGFYGLAVPIVQPSVIAAATDAATAISKCNEVIVALKALGLVASA